MRSSIGQAATPEIESIVQDLLREDTVYDNSENRTAHRENLVRPVKITVRRPGDDVLTAFSRNISASGIGLITDHPIAPDTGNAPGGGSVVDMGAFEFPGDCNGNGTTDDLDIDGGFMNLR